MPGVSTLVTKPDAVFLALAGGVARSVGTGTAGGAVSAAGGGVSTAAAAELALLAAAAGTAGGAVSEDAL